MTKLPVGNGHGKTNKAGKGNSGEQNYTVDVPSLEFLKEKDRASRT